MTNIETTLTELTAEKIKSLTAYMESISINDLADNKDFQKMVEKRQELSLWRNVEFLIKEGLTTQEIMERMTEVLISEMRPTSNIAELLAYKTIIRELKYC